MLDRGAYARRSKRGGFHPQRARAEGCRRPACRILLKSVSREPADRYPTATAFKDALLKLKKQDY